jgi:DNA polymerase III sliding clamp (beta) subunit (PCNA family)
MCAQIGNPAILLGHQHDITAFCTSDESRYVLTGVHFNAKEMRLEATDGRMVIFLPVLLDKEEEFPSVALKRKGYAPTKSCIIPAKAIPEAMERISPRSSLLILKKVRLEVEHNDGEYAQRVTLTATNLDQEYMTSSKVIEGHYPNINQVLPQGDPQWKIALSPTLLKKLADYAYQHCNDKHQSIYMEGWSSIDPVRIKMTVGDEQQEAICVLMPLRLEK